MKKLSSEISNIIKRILVVNNNELSDIGNVLREVLNTKPKKFKFNLSGATESAIAIKKIHNR